MRSYAGSMQAASDCALPAYEHIRIYIYIYIYTYTHKCVQVLVCIYNRYMQSIGLHGTHVDFCHLCSASVKMSESQSVKRVEQKAGGLICAASCTYLGTVVRWR